ncbi:sensor histidine kinase [Tessaracoccus sp. OS52]|uniref:sensor histidine kinase n=1 Tax=Tessaracoccus sp. OS52 TaxID=2886691 RepID=UPI001D10CD62|nr:sensor histidine kinase [Tessaracoccus sp. OS52]
MTIPTTAEASDVGSEEGRWLGRGLVAAPFVLLALAFVVTLALGGAPVAPDRLPWLIAVTSTTLGLRLWLLRCGSRGERIAGFVLNLALTLALVSMSPVFGIYAFVGYLDAVAVFPARGQAWALIAAASLSALAQSGGPDGVVQRPVLFGFLLLANGGLAVGMVHVDRHRQQTVTRLRAALDELEEAHRINEALQHQIVEQARESGVLEERQRLSRDIHDTVAQGLIAALRQIEAASESSSLTDARAVLDRVDRTVRDCLAEARRAVSALASPLLDHSDLHYALSSLCAAWSEGTRIAATFRTTGDPNPTPHDADLLRICQEALSNVAKHSHATAVDVTLTYTTQDVRLRVADDGDGFDPAATTGGFGLAGIRERLRGASGALDLELPEGGGCVLTAVVPT